MKPEARPNSLENNNDACISWRYFAPPGHTLEMCCDPRYWDNLHRELGQQRIAGRHAWNRVEIIAEDGSWEADVRVLSIGAEGVRLRVLREWPDVKKAAVPPKANLPVGYKVEHVPSNGWRVIDAKGKVTVDKLTTEDDAIRAATQHARKAA